MGEILILLTKSVHPTMSPPLSTAPVTEGQTPHVEMNNRPIEDTLPIKLESNS